MGTAGQRFDEYSAPAVADAVRRILELPPNREAALRAAAREAAVEHFAVGQVVDGLLDILRSARAGSRTR
jgi:glycosyltransferase involved in cell wall biosynthesis